MTFQDKLVRHERLMNRMASRNGADLALAEQVGLADPQEIFEAAQACTGCAAVPACEELLDTEAVEVPGYCRNAAMIRRIACDMHDLGITGD